MGNCRHIAEYTQDSWEHEPFPNTLASDDVAASYINAYNLRMGTETLYA